MPTVVQVTEALSSCQTIRAKPVSLILLLSTRSRLTDGRANPAPETLLNGQSGKVLMFTWIIGGTVVLALLAFKVLRSAEADDKKRKTVPVRR